MRWLGKIRMAMLTLVRRGAQTERLNEELAFHVEQQTAENIANGMNAREARSAALRSFGNPTALRDETRATWNWGWLEKFGRDVHYGARTLRRSPGFTCIAILVMALGIGATASLFTIVNAVLLKPLPFHDPSRLVMIYEHFRAPASNSGGFNYTPVAAADFRDWRQQTHSFQEMAGWYWYEFNFTGARGELPERIVAAGGSWNLFQMLGVPMAAGRSFSQQEDQPGGTHVAILTWNMFQRRFHGDRSIIGQQVHLNLTPYTVIGILPRWFAYPDATVQLWVPYAQALPLLMYNQHAIHESYVVARLRQGTTATAAVKPVSALQYRMHMAHLSEPVTEDAVTRPMLADVVQDIKTPLIVLLSAVCCMLLIACLNLSNLLVARGAARRKEVAVRGALGGSRGTLILEQMTESLLICLIGGGLGLLLSLVATKWLATHLPNLPRADAIHVDGAVLAFSLGLVLLATLLAGLVPALSSTGKGVFAALQDSSRSVGGSASRASLRKALLSAEIALTVILLVSAGLLFKSFLHLRSSGLGCTTDHVLTMHYSLPKGQYDTPEKVVAFHESLLERVRRLPGVRAAALVSTAPGNGYESDRVFTIPSRPPASSVLQDDAMTRSAGPNYFTTMKIPVLRGRVFTDQERLQRYHRIVVTRKFADQYFPNADPVGQDINMAWDGLKRENYQIVGVVGDTLWSVTQPSRAMVYFPIFSGTPESRGATLVVRTARDPLMLSIPIQKQFASLDPSLPVSDVLTMRQIVDADTAGQNFNATLVLAFAGLSLLLAAIGLYGVLSYLVAQRVKEIGIRIALGAQRSQVLGLVLLDGLRPVFIGLLVGIAGGVAAGLLIRSILYGTSPADPLVFALMVGCLLITAVAACVVPALRAAQIEPIQALRAE